MNKAAGLEDKIIIPGEISFFDTGMPDSSFDVVISQDSMLHAGSGRPRAIAEAARVLKPGGRMVLTDYIQAEDAEASDLQTVRGGEGKGGGGGAVDGIDWWSEAREARVLFITPEYTLTVRGCVDMCPRCDHPSISRL